MPSTRDVDNRQKSRRHLVLALSNEDEGEHVDPNLHPDYKAIAKEDQWGGCNWTEALLFPKLLRSCR